MAAIQARLDGRQRQLALAIAKKNPVDRIRDIVVTFKEEYVDHECSLKERKAAGDPLIRAEVQAWSLVRAEYVEAINHAVSYLDDHYPEDSDLRLTEVEAMKFKFGEPRRSPGGSRSGYEKGRPATDAVPVRIGQNKLVEVTAEQPTVVTTSLTELGQSMVGPSVVTNTEIDQSQTRIQPSSTKDPQVSNTGVGQEPPNGSSGESTAYSVPSQHTATPMRDQGVLRSPKDPWKAANIFGTSGSGRSSRTTEWVLTACPTEVKDLSKYLRNQANSLERASVAVKEQPTAKTVRRLRNAAEAARAILDKAEGVFKANLPDDFLIEPMDELNVAIEEAETILMPYIEADGSVIATELDPHRKGQGKLGP